MVEYIEKSIDLTRNYNQFKSRNDLICDIIDVLDVTEDIAEDTAAAICKVVTFWIEAYSKGLIDIDFPEFYKKCIDEKYVVKDKHGFYTYLALSLEQLADKFDIQLYEIKTFPELQSFCRNEEFLGTVRIEKKNNMHSMICYRNADGRLRISDTGRRGIDVNLFEFVNEENFKYCTVMEV